MPNTPGSGDVHVSVPLTNISIAYTQDTAGFIADKVFPNIPVRKQADRYWQYSRADWNRDEMEVRAPATESAGGGYNLDNSPTYYAPVYSYHKDIDDQTRSNEDSPLDGDTDGTEFVTWKALLKRERTWATNYFRPGIWTFGAVGVSAAPDDTEFLQWDNANSTPIEDVRKARRKVHAATGIKPNKLVLGARVYDALIDHPDVIDRVKYGQTPGAPAQANVDTLSKLFEVEVLVAEAVVNTGPKGKDYTAAQAFEANDFVLPDHALLCYANPRPTLRTPSAGYTFSWSGYLGASAMGHVISKFRMQHLKADRIEVEMAYDQKVVGADLGYLFETAIHNPAS